MPAAKPPEFRRRAVELARLREQPIAKIAQDLGISESCLRRWMGQADVDLGAKEGLTTGERRELAELRRRNGCWRWRWRSSSAPAPTSRGRTCSQNDLPGGLRARRGPVMAGCPSR